MKLYIKGLLLSGLLAGTTACTDLDVDLDARYEQLPDNPIVVEGEFNGCYRYLNGWFGRDFIEGVVYQGDELYGINLAGSYWDEGRIFYSSVHSLHLDLWNTRIMEACLNGCSYTNTKIAAYGGPEFNDPVVAPLRAIRAYYHFWMMELYGDCPIMDHVLVEGEPNPSQSSRADVCRWIEKELLEILNQEGALSKANDASTYGKPNYWMAAALLAKVYLNWGVYTNDITTVDNNTANPKLNDCIHWCDEIIKSGIFEVGTGYRKKFFPDNGVHIKDFIYAIDCDPNGKNDGTVSYYRWMGFRLDGYIKPGLISWKPSDYNSVAGCQIMTKEAVDRFCLPNDERNLMVLKGPQCVIDRNYQFTNEPVYLYVDANRENTKLFQLDFKEDFEFEDASIYDVGAEKLPAANANSKKDGTAWLNARKGARLYKYPVREEDYSTWERQQANDAPIFRLADILLMKAECITRGGTATLGDTPESLINQVRACSGAPSVNVGAEAPNPAPGLSPIQQVLLDERSRELILEPWRRNDLIRFGQFEADWAQKNRYKVWDNAEHTQFHWVDREGVKDPRRRLMPMNRYLLETNLHWHQTPGYQGL